MSYTQIVLDREIEIRKSRITKKSKTRKDSSKRLDRYRQGDPGQAQTSYISATTVGK